MSKPQQQEKKKTKKRRRAPRFHEPRKHAPKVIARQRTCPQCGHRIRINEQRVIAWHRSDVAGKRCPGSRRVYTVET